MCKMGSHDPFGYLKHKLWPKKGLGVKFDSRPLKVGNCPEFVACKWRVTYYWKALDEVYNISSNLILIEGLHTKLCSPKVSGVSTLGISRLPLGSLGTKWHLSVGSMARQKVYYKGEGDGFPQVQVMVSFMSPCFPVAHPYTKSTQTRH
jgi:hypothetical protein